MASNSALLRTLDVFCPYLQESCPKFLAVGSKALDKACTLGFSVCDAVGDSQPENLTLKPFVTLFLTLVLMALGISILFMMISSLFGKSDKDEKEDKSNEDDKEDKPSKAAKWWEKVEDDISARTDDDCYFAEILYDNGDLHHALLLLKCLASFTNLSTIALPWQKVVVRGRTVTGYPDILFRKNKDYKTLRGGFEETPAFAHAIFLYAMGCLRKSVYDEECAALLRQICADCLNSNACISKPILEPDTATPATPDAKVDTATPDSKVDTATPDSKVDTATPDTKVKDSASTVSLDVSTPDAKIDAATPDTKVKDSASKVPLDVPKSAETRWKKVWADVKKRSTNEYFAVKLYRDGDAHHAKLLLKCLISFQNYKDVQLPWERVIIDLNGLKVNVDSDQYQSPYGPKGYGFLETFVDSPKFIRGVFLYALGCLRDPRSCKHIYLLNKLKKRCP